MQKIGCASRRVSRADIQGVLQTSLTHCSALPSSPSSLKNGTKCGTIQAKHATREKSVSAESLVADHNKGGNSRLSQAR